MPSTVITVEMKIDGSTEVEGDSGTISFKNGQAIQRVQVDQRLDCPDFFSVDLTLMSHTAFQLVDALKPGQEVEIVMGYDTQATVFKGEISYVEPSFSTDKQRVTVSGYDKTHRLTRGSNSRTWGDGVEASQDRGTIGGDVVGQSMARKGEVRDSLSATADSVSTKVEYVPQFETNDYQFLRSLGLSTALQIVPRSAEDTAKLTFTAVDLTADPSWTVCRERPDPPDASLAIQADFALSTVKQAARVEVRGWNQKEKKAILGKSEASTKKFAGTTGYEMAGEAHYGSASAGRVLTVVDEMVADNAEAETLAKAIFDALAMQYVKAEVVIEGNPEIVPGDTVELKDFGQRYSGNYLIEALQHYYCADSHDPYVVRLQLARNACPDV